MGLRSWIRSLITPWVFKRTSQLDSQKGKAKETIKAIAGQVRSKHVTYEEFNNDRTGADKDFSEDERPDRIRRNEVAWGQYLVETQYHGVGTYGTAAAVQILDLAQEQSENELQEKGLRWLRNEWNVGSHTWRTQQIDILYRIVAFRRAIGVDGCSDFDLDCPCERLWDKKDGDSYRRKWGEYNYENGPTDEERNISTVMALYALRDSPAILSNQERAEEYHRSLCNFTDDIQDLNDKYDKRRIVNTSLCLLALTGYWELLDSVNRRSVATVDIPDAQKKKRDIESKISDLAQLLSKDVRADQSFLESYYIRLFTTPRPTLRDRYYPFAVGPIAALALLKAGGINNNIWGRNIYFLTEFIDHYADELNVNSDGKFKTSERGEASIGDHLWVAEAFNEFTKMSDDAIPTSSLVRSWWTQMPLTNLVYILPIILLLGVYGYFSFKSNGVEAAATTLLSIVVGALLIALGFTPALGEWIRRTL